MESIEYDSENCASRWLGYFDLMGTSELIKSGRTEEVFDACQEAIDRLKTWKKRHPSVYHDWFSDTFIMFSEDDSALSFTAIEMVCRWFVFSLISRNIPVRGALSCGKFYADRENSLYLGSALVDAHKWGESQDWIGFILCPSSVERLEILNLPVKERLNYVEYDVPFKKPAPRTVRVGACILGNMILGSDGRNLLLAKLVEMAKPQKDPMIRLKYTRTIEFLTKNERKQIIK